MKVEITGRLHFKGQTNNVSDKFSKRDAVILVEDGKFTQHIQIQFQNANTALLDPLNVGDKVKCQINITGREWTNKEGKVSYFNSLVCWALESEKPKEVFSQPQSKPQGNIVADSGDELNLPF